MDYGTGDLNLKALRALSFGGSTVDRGTPTPKNLNPKPLV